MQPYSMRKWLPAYIALGFSWGCSFILIKNSLEFLTPIGVGFFRLLLGAATLILWMKLRGIVLPRDRRLWGHLWVMSILLNSLPGFLFAYAQTQVSSVMAGIINASTPLMTVVLVAFVLRTEKITSSEIVGVLIGFAGVLTVLGIWNGVGTGGTLALLALLGAVLCFSFSYPYARKYLVSEGLDLSTLAAIQVLLGSLTLLPFYVVEGESINNPTISGVLSMVLLGVLASGFAYVWNFRVMSLAGSVVASSVSYLIPLVAILVGFVFANEKISWNQLLGAFIILCGAAISQKAGKSN